ncbi:MAG: hypothetical protein C5B50_23895 [Verrucomicrobia bacterium]|nr:MAG: hypothetical protein C5B50_23895 [Verrucomicrobiota bacterium]
MRVQGSGFRRTNTKLQRPNTRERPNFKLQTPNFKKASTFNLQRDRWPPAFEAWSLIILWSLEFEI